ncbi:hypothetical protein P175DRAFT_0426655, partial [Aspergillus ochraceoroseus IBT 24754]
ECAKSKRRCSKDNIPCSRCRQLNLRCTRETVQLRRHTVRHGDEIKFLSSLQQQQQQQQQQQLAQIVLNVKGRITQLQTGSDAPPREVPPSDSISHLMPPDHDKSCAPETTDALLCLTAIEHLAWGRNSAGCFPHLRCGCQYSRSSPNGSQALIDSQKLPFLGPVHVLQALNVSFVDASTAEALVRIHLSHLAWHHDCLHTPTFLEQCGVFWETGRCDHPLWMALYFSVLSSTVFSMRNSNKKARAAVDLDLDTVPSAEEFFKSMLHVLYTCHFLYDLSVYSVQAVVISTEVAHNFGLSQLNATLFNAAVRIAECLGLHRINDAAPDTQEEWIERVQREVGKRVWCQLVIQDNFAISFTDTYSISPTQYSTGPPLNADDSDLVERPPSVPTVSTYVRVLREIAVLMPSLVDGLGSMSQPKPLREQYAHVLRLDRQLRSAVKEIPPFLLRPDRDQEARFPWLGIARRSLAITAAEKIIMIHRPFLFRSFNSRSSSSSSPSYQYTRRTCVAAAVTILREHETICNEGDFFIWTHSAFCITAAIILCFEVSAAAADTPPSTGKEDDDYRAAILAARSRLAAQKSDVLAQRGVALIDTIFSSEARHPELDFDRISADFLRLNRLNAAPLFMGVSDATSAELVYSSSTSSPDSLPVDVDFEPWFHDIFSHLDDQT